jgi:hypothetical protein
MPDYQFGQLVGSIIRIKIVFKPSMHLIICEKSRYVCVK